MRNIKSKLTYLLATLFLLVFLNPAAAKNNDRPDALSDRGPLTKVTFIHYKKGYAKPPWAGGGNGGGSSKCYAFLANGARWKETETYSINSSNTYGLSEDFMLDATTAGADQWNNQSGYAIFGTPIIDQSVAYDDTKTDEVNTLSFGAFPQNNVIAVTNVWGYFSGPPQTRELVEWDMLLNTSSSWSWGDAGSDPSLMDVQNIVAHEIGHAAGMGHPDSSCIAETMYAYSTEGEILKRDLNPGDVAGIKALYQ